MPYKSVEWDYFLAIFIKNTKFGLLILKLIDIFENQQSEMLRKGGLFFESIGCSLKVFLWVFR